MLLAVPPAVHAVADRTLAPVPSSVAALQRVVDRALRSASVEHSGLVESRGALGLPDLPRLGGVAGLLGGTTRTRVFWSSPRAWRVDRLLATGEADDYGLGPDLVSWNYEDDHLRTVLGTGTIRLPRPDDLLPPQLARRVLHGLGSTDRLVTLPGRRVAGRPTLGVRVLPDSALSTVGAFDVWTDEATGLPLQVRVTDLAGREALGSRFLDVSFGAPSAAVLRPPEAVGAGHDVGQVADLADAINQIHAFSLPAQLAGLPATTPLAQVGGSETYGDGLARFVLLPLPGHMARSAMRSATDGGGIDVDVPGGRAVLLTSSGLGVLVGRGDSAGRGYLLAGLVTPQTLQRALTALFADIPERR